MADSLNKNKGNRAEGEDSPAASKESVNIADIEKLFSLMQDNEIAELKIEQYKTKIHIVSKAAPAAVPQQPMISYMPAGMPQYQMMPMQGQQQQANDGQPQPPQLADGVTASAQPTAQPEAGDDLPPNAKTVLSPMVGTFYRASSPESPAFVKEGDVVNDDTVLCIIEAMKLMNEIKAETRGKIVRVLVENGMPVEFNQPLFLLEP